MHMRIGPLTLDDTSAYLRVRLGRIGCDLGLFVTEAAMLNEAATDAHRDLDMIAAPRSRRRRVARRSWWKA